MMASNIPTDENTLTVEKIEKIWAAMKGIQQPQVISPSRIVFTHDAMKDTDERTFPISRHRSKRILKKLLRRHGGFFKKAPAMFTFGDTIFAHPSFEAEIKRQFKERTDHAVENAVLRGDAPLGYSWGGIPVFGGPLYSFTGN